MGFISVFLCWDCVCMCVPATDREIMISVVERKADGVYSNT